MQQGGNATQMVKHMIKFIKFKKTFFVIILVLVASLLMACIGIPGESGEDGLRGLPGLPGIDGSTGPQGPAGANGNDGIDGQDGRDGEHGITPRIGADGNWWIGYLNTGVLAHGLNGIQGTPGTNGQDGQDGQTPRIYNGYWWIGNTNTGVAVGSSSSSIRPTGVLVHNDEIFGLVLRWNNSSAISMYEVEIRRTGSPNYSIKRITGNQFSFTLMANMQLDILYHFRVRSVNRIMPDNFTEWSAPFVIGIPIPQVPINLTIEVGSVLQTIQDLPERFGWEEPQYFIEQTGLRTFYALYRREGNWLPVNNIPIQVLVV